MNIWMICPYGPVPGEGWREYRFSAIGRALAERGHTVLWWTASFSHHFKRQRVSKSITREVNNGFSIRFIRTSGYRKHIGFARLLFEAVFAFKVHRQGRNMVSPDIVICGDTTMAASQVAISVARRHRAKLVVDVMDLWPEIFESALAPWLRKYSPTLFAPFFWLRGRTFASADAVTAVSHSYLEYALRASPKLREHRSLVAYIGVDLASLRTEPLRQWNCPDFPLKKEGDVFAIYAGTLGEAYDIGTLLKACSLLHHRFPRIKIVIAGSGPRAAEVEEYLRVEKLPNLSFLGAVAPEDLAVVYQLCDIGLCLYAETSTVAIPVKVFDYLAAGLPIVNSLRGELASILERDHSGMNYTAGDESSLAAIIEMLARDQCERERMSLNCLNSAIQFDAALQYSKITDLVENLFAERELANAHNLEDVIG